MEWKEMQNDGVDAKLFSDEHAYRYTLVGTVKFEVIEPSCRFAQPHTLLDYRRQQLSLDARP